MGTGYESLKKSVQNDCSERNSCNCFNERGNTMSDVYRGNGAECMVQFMKNGCKGVVRICGSDSYVINEKRWLHDRRLIHIGWVDSPCEYYPPEPVWRDATPGEALDAWIAGKTVSYKTVATGSEWHTLHTHTLDDAAGYWTYGDHKYRIQEETP